MPIMLVLALAIIDLARIYTTMLTVESAAREAADYGTFGSQKWNNAVFYLPPPNGTEAKMLHRACVAAKNLPDYVGPDDGCTNPSFIFQQSPDSGVTWGAPGVNDTAYMCDDPVRTPPCWIKVTLTYDFKLLAPFAFEVFGTRYGEPSTMTFTRSSVFAMTDLKLPVPTP